MAAKQDMGTGSIKKLMLQMAVVLTTVFYFAAPTLLRLFGASDATLSYAVFLAEPVSDLIAAAVTTFMFFRFFLKMLKEGKAAQQV